MTTQNVANRFHELAQTGQWNLIHNEINADKGFRKQKTGELFRNLTYTGTV